MDRGSDQTSGPRMKAQYFGDVNDYRKFALLRLLATEGDFKIGVCWLLTPDEGSKREYLGKPSEWQEFDPSLFDQIRNALAERPVSGLDQLEMADTIPGASYFNELVPSGRTARESFHQRCMAALDGVDLAFFDPDNGLETKAHPKGRPNSRKYVYLDEIADHYAAGRSVLVYQHFPRVERQSFLATVRDALTANCEKSTIVIFSTAHVAFALAIHPEHAKRATRVVHAAQQRWPSRFMSVNQNA